ncbi:hypothetical protein N182_13670 [Sinorhizobium sp. GL2]|nr:hypothetical protein N182_13670 [Sinorhizobium sp. GL2]
MSSSELHQLTLASGEFPTVSARRLQNVVLEAFAPRYLIDDAAPAKLLKALSPRLAKDDLRALCFVHTCRANLILGDFVRQVYWPRYSAGASFVSGEDSLGFVKSAVSDGRTTTHWSSSTVTRVASYLLGACADFGLLGPMRGGSRSINTFRVTPSVSSILAHDLHFRGLGDNALLRSSDWGLFGLEADDVLGELKRVALRGEIIVQSAGGLTQISWKFKSMEELANGFAQS